MCQFLSKLNCVLPDSLYGRCVCERERWADPGSSSGRLASRTVHTDSLQQASRSTICAHLGSERVCALYWNAICPPAAHGHTTPSSEAGYSRSVWLAHTERWLACDGVVGYWIISLVFNLSCYCIYARGEFRTHSLSMKHDNEAVDVFLQTLAVHYI